MIPVVGEKEEMVYHLCDHALRIFRLSIVQNYSDFFGFWRPLWVLLISLNFIDLPEVVDRGGISCTLVDRNTFETYLVWLSGNLFYFRLEYFSVLFEHEWTTK